MLSKIGKAVLAVVLSLTMIVAGCNPAWITTVTGAISTFLPAALQLAQLILMFNNKGVIPEEDAAYAQRVLDEARKDLALINSLVQQYQKADAATKATLLNEINALAKTTYANLSDLMAALHIKDAKVQGEISAGVSLLLMFLELITSKIPGAVQLVPSASAQDARAAVAGVKLDNAADFQREWQKLGYDKLLSGASQ